MSKDTKRPAPLRWSRRKAKAGQRLSGAGSLSIGFRE